MMNVIITGGSGLIGRALSQNLVEHGHQVWVLTRGAGQMLLPPGVEAVRWDGRSAQGWAHLLAECDAVVNLAGAGIGDSLWSQTRKEVILNSRVAAGRAVALALASAPQRKRVLIQASAVGFYGVNHGCALDENAPAGADFLAQVCNDWEASTLAVEESEVRRVIIRTGLVLARQGGVLARMALPFRLFAGGPLGSGRQIYSWIHLEDEIEAIRFLMENELARGVYNLTAPSPVSMAVFGKVMARVLHRPFWLPAPAFMLKLVLGEMSTLLLDGQDVRPARLTEAGFRFKYSEIEAALQNLLL